MARLAVVPVTAPAGIVRKLRRNSGIREGQIVEAFQFTGEHVELKPWLNGDQYMFVASNNRVSLHVDTTEGGTVAHPGSWVERDERGRLYIHSDHYIRSFYDEVLDQ